jgi:hypothetical protein
MATWIIVALVAAIVIIGFLLWRSSKKPTVEIPNRPIMSGGTAPVAYGIEPSPGIDPTTGTVPNNPPPPTPEGSIGLLQRVGQFSGMLQHVPVLSRTTSLAKSVANSPINLTLKINDLTRTSLEHVPVLGKALATPSKYAGKVGSSVSKMISSIW